MDYKKVWSLLRSETESERRMARISGMSPSGFKSMMERETMTVETLETIARHFKKSLNYFSDIDISSYVSNNDQETENSNNTHYIAPESPLNSCDNPACLKRISELEDDKNLLKEYNKLLKAQLARGGLDEGKSSEGGLEESPTGS